MLKADHSPRQRSRHKLMVCGLVLCTLPLLWSGCDEQTQQKRKRDVAPMVMLHPRQFQGPGTVGQALDANGRVLVFLELTDSKDGTPLDIDPAWTFTLHAKNPRGDEVMMKTDPAVPRAWANDPGIRLIGGFTANQTGIYEIEVRSENCPYRKAPFVLLPLM